MALQPISEIRTVTYISVEERQRIIDFLQGAVYCWCKNRKGEWFSMRDLMGGENYFWQGTPLIILYEKHRNKGKDEDSSVRDAGKDSGWLLKSVINDDQRLFENRYESFINQYRWIVNE